MRNSWNLQEVDLWRVCLEKRREPHFLKLFLFEFKCDYFVMRFIEEIIIDFTIIALKVLLI